MMLQPSRILNEGSTLFGLSIGDLAVLGYSLIFINTILGKFGFELVSFPIVGAMAWGLIRIRMRARDKIIRDWLSYHLLSQIISRKV